MTAKRLSSFTLRALLAASFCIQSLSVNASETTKSIHFVKDENGVSVFVGDDLFTRYLISGNKPILWPVIGPSGKEITRAYPISKHRKNEATDHNHHRSIWIGYEGLNSIDFWHDSSTTHSTSLEIGQTNHKEFKVVEAADNTGKIIALNDWINASRELVCSDRRTMIFGFDQNQRWIDIQLDLIASEGPVRISDSKEGFVALRVASSIKVDAQQGGTIINSRGDENHKAWSKRAEWVDYHGQIEGEDMGIAILSYPTSFGSPPRWHVRTYGLFSANPFGELAFTEPNSKVLERPLRHTIPTGESLSFRYKIIFHLGNHKKARIAEQYSKLLDKSVDDGTTSND